MQFSIHIFWSHKPLLRHVAVADKWAVSFRASEATPKLLDELLESVSLECPLGLYNDQSWEAMACLSELRVTGELRCYTRHGVVLPLEAETSLVLFTWAQKKVSFAAFAILFLAVVALVFYWREGRCQGTLQYPKCSHLSRW